MEKHQNHPAQQLQRLDRQNKRLQFKVRALRRILWCFIFLFCMISAYQVYSEIKAPLFGKWPEIAREKSILEENQKLLVVKIDSLRKANDILMENSPYYSGVFFEVQIGAFQHFDLSNYGEALTKFKVEYKEELHKYTLGKFRKLEMAEAFRKDMETLGIKDAFVVAKIEGVRTSIEEAVQYQKNNTSFTL